MAIQKITEGTTGEQAAEILYNNDLETAETAETAEIKTNLIEGALDTSFNGYSSFDGSAVIQLENELTLDSVGDFIEFKGRITTGLPFQRTIGIAGRPVVNSDVFGYISVTEIDLRESGSSLPYLKWTNLDNLTNFNTIRLEVVPTGWELFINGVSKGIKTKTSSLIIANIGSAYNPAEKSIFDLIDVRIKAGSTTIEIDKPFLVGENVKLGYEPIVKAENIEGLDGLIEQELDTTPNCFYDYDPNGGGGFGLIRVFIKRERGVYVGHHIWRDKDLSELAHKDVYRIAKADEYTYNGTSMVLLRFYALGPGESENVYRQVSPDKVDFTGGFHGDEILSKVKFLADNIEVEFTDETPLTPCDIFEYIQVSTTYETANVVGGVVPGHPEQSTHTKHTSFYKGGYSSWNSYKWLAAFEMFWYSGISCLGKIQATRGFNEYLDEAEFTGDGLTYDLQSEAREFRVVNTLLGKTGKVTSEIIKPKELDASSWMFIDDRPNDSKYYRRTANTVTVIGEEWVSIMHVHYD